MKKWWIGCSGFHYKNWRGTFYPSHLPQKDWFEYYCQHFNAIELNVSFYRFPTVESLKKWRQTSPAHFSFSVKVPRLITHYKKFKNCKRQIQDFYSLVARGLEEKTGSILFQLHPRYAYSAERLDALVNATDSTFTNVIEFRHASWWNKETLSVLSENGICFAGISHPELPEDVIHTCKTAYYRFHGVPHLYHSSYHHRTLKKKQDELNALPVKRVFVFFNNDATVAAPRNAKTLIKYSG